MQMSELPVHMLKCIVRGHVCCRLIQDSSLFIHFIHKSIQRCYSCFVHANTLPYTDFFFRKFRLEITTKIKIRATFATSYKKSRTCHGFLRHLTSRQTCEKLKCLYENLMSNNFPKTWQRLQMKALRKLYRFDILAPVVPKIDDAVICSSFLIRLLLWGGGGGGLFKLISGSI